MSVAAESRVVLALKGLILVAAVVVFLAPLATPAGLVAAGVGGVLGFVLAHRLVALVRLSSGVVLGLATIGLGQLGAGGLVDQPLGLGPSKMLFLGDAVSLGSAALGGLFTLRLLSQRLRGFAVLEFALIIGVVAHSLANHRHQRIHQPRVLSDWAWSRGLDLQVILTALGVVAVTLAALLLLRVRRGSRLVAMLLVLLIFFGLVASLLTGRINSPVEGDELGLTGFKQNEEQKGEPRQKPEGQQSKLPEPVAVAVLHEDLPDAEVLYFRQSARSRQLGDRLVADTSGQFDLDLPVGFPTGAPLKLNTPQAPLFHRPIHTSMYLLVDHAQLLGLGNPTAIRLLQNPNPRRFVAAYDVDSLFLIRPIERLMGRQALPPGWSQSEREHYLAAPADPRYLKLSNQLVREVDPRFVGDEVMKALAIRQYLERKGFYSLEEKTLIGDEPTATFLFGDLRGYCVHFAHAAVFLLRSQGIPARVALGYAVETRNRGAGSAVLVFAHQAHAWPELYLDGVGWVTFDIQPEKSDQPPSQYVDQDLQSALGELTRNAANATPFASKALNVPWATLFASLFGLVLTTAYSIKLVRRFAKSSHRLVYRSVLDQLSDRGVVRQFGESREQHAARVARLAPSFVPLTATHLQLAFRGDSAQTQPPPNLLQLARATAEELHRNSPWLTRARALFNPIGWWFTR